MIINPFVFAAAGPPTPSIRGLIALYPLDETSGSIAHDVSGNGNHGSYGGPNVSLAQTSILPSGDGSGVSFGTLSYMSLPVTLLQTMTPPFTIFGFGNSTNASASGHGQQIMASEAGGFNFYLYQSNMYGGIAGISNNIIDSRTILSNVTHMWALTVNSAGDAIIYDNASASSTASSAFSPSTTFTNTVLVGNYSGNLTSNNFIGTLQYVGICNVDLSGSEIADILAAA